LTNFQAKQNAITVYIDKACQIFGVAEYLKKEMITIFENSKVIPFDAAALAAFAIVTDREMERRNITDQITLEKISKKCGVNMFQIQKAQKKMVEERKEQGRYQPAGKIYFLFTFLLNCLLNSFLNFTLKEVLVC